MSRPRGVAFTLVGTNRWTYTYRGRTLKAVTRRCWVCGVPFPVTRASDLQSCSPAHDGAAEEAARALAEKRTREYDPPIGDGILVILDQMAILAVSIVAAVVVGSLTSDVVVAAGAAVGGIAFGTMWAFGIGGISDWKVIRRRIREQAWAFSFFGAPFVSVAVAAMVGAGYGWAVAAALVPAAAVGAGLWLLHRYLDPSLRSS